MLKNKSGFTLIELLIVIVIIGILSAVFINTSAVNLKRARDAKRKSDLELIRTGIETYRADCNTYPVSNTPTDPVSAFGGTSLVGNPANGVNCLAANKYINTVPTDPKSATQTYIYWSDGNTYQICATLETGGAAVTCGNVTPPNSVQPNCNVGGSALKCNYQATNP